MAKKILIRIADSATGVLTTGQLVRLLGITRPNTCTYLTRLSEADFIKTARGRGDQKKRYHSLTPHGRAYMDSWGTGEEKAYEEEARARAEAAITPKKPPVVIEKSAPLTEKEKEFLSWIDEKKSVTTSELISFVGMSRANTSAYLGKLRGYGLVVSAKKGGGTYRYHSLTEKGRAKVDEELSKSENDLELSKLLEDCDKIVYNDEFSIETEEGMMLSF